jgi:SAM-dependent methyltransferase
MRQTIKDFVSIIATTLPVEEPIYEFGSLQVAGQEGFADLRPFFPGRKYVGADLRPGPGVDRVLDLHRIDLPADSVGAVLCLDTLEHVEYPHRALEEIHRVLHPRGVAVISSVMCYPIHDYPCDYWRFTPEAFRSLLKPFHESFVGCAGAPSFPHTVVGIGFKGDAPELAGFSRKFEKWQEPQRSGMFAATGTPLVRTVKLLSPPVLQPLLSRVYRMTCELTRRSP